ncbi:velvet factor-domain-containing protein [Suillus cothurnatus]|nr:velvet factor-domain-containing protein [Suillus cothurnatus]
MDPATYHPITAGYGYADRDRGYHERDRLEYELTVRQEPKQARMCGVGADRRPIDPPPIIQLRVIDPQTRQPPSPARLDGDDSDPSYAHSFLQNPYYFMFASLAKPDDDTELHWLKDGKTRCTTGSVVSSLYHLKDTENRNEDAGFFVFPDLSVRTEGSYRLKLSLFEVVGNTVRHCKSIYSAPFYVYTAKKFPGMEESTPLSCSLADQGIKIRIRKDIRVRKRPIAALVTPIDAENNNEEDENDTPVSAVTSTAHSKRPRHGTVSSNGAPDLQTPTGSLVGLPAWPSSTSLDPMLGAPSAPGGVELPAPTHPPPSAPPGGAIPPPRGASYESSRLGGSIPPPPGAQLIAPPAAATFENSRNAPPSIPSSSTVSQRQTMHPPAQTTPFSSAAPVFNSQGRVTYEAPRTSTFDSPRSYEGRGAYEPPDQRGYESSRTAYEPPSQRTAYPSGYDGQSATSNTFQESYPPAGQYSSQPTTSNQYQHPSSSSHQQYPSSSRPQSQYGAPPSNTYPTPTPYSQSQSRYEYPPQQPQQYASPNGDSYYESSPAASSGPPHNHGQPSYYPSSQSSGHPPSWNTPTPPANPQPYSSSPASHAQSYEFNHQQPYPNSSASDYYQPSNSTHSQAQPTRVTSPTPSRYANQSYTSSSNEQAYTRHQQSTYASTSAGGIQPAGSHHEWPVASPASAWNNPNSISSGSEHGLIQLAPLRQHPSSSARQHASSSSSSSSDASSPVAGNTNTPGGGGGAYPLIQLSRAPFEHDARVGLQGKKNVLSIGSIISDGA